MKKYLSSILLLILSATLAHAEPASGLEGQGMHGKGPNLEHMKARLGLSDEQVEQMRDIRDNGGNREDMRAVLTDEQRALMDQHRAERGGQRGGPGGRGPKMERMKAQLGLSDEQVAQMREIRDNGGNREDMRAVLTEEQRALLEQHRTEYNRQRGQGDGKGRRGPPPAGPVEDIDG